MPAIDRKACALCGEICEKPIAAGASDDVDTIQLSLKHSFKIGQGAGVARCEAFKNYACKPRLVAGFIGYWLCPAAVICSLMRAGMLPARSRGSASTLIAAAGAQAAAC